MQPRIQTTIVVRDGGSEFEIDFEDMLPVFVGQAFSRHMFKYTCLATGLKQCRTKFAIHYFFLQESVFLDLSLCKSTLHKGKIPPPILLLQVYRNDAFAEVCDNSDADNVLYEGEVVSEFSFATPPPFDSYKHQEVGPADVHAMYD